ncbi:MAG: DAK2 domain-containing protein [Bacillota bacterium]|nr:DAK2 domain-containing protein [Bacillota bacterium]
MRDGYIDGTILQAALKETVDKLHEKREALNRINIFPVPDGDTGNNMLATLESACRETEKTASPSLHAIANAAYCGAREGSTGNSGAIFAQYLGGWAAAFSNLEAAGAETISKAQALGTKNAYGAVLKPVEGTILTVAREAAEAAEKEASGENLTSTLLASYHQARKALVKTAKVLPVLRDQKMIDAGGWGLLIFISAILTVMNIPTGKAEFNFKASSNYFKSRDDYEFDHPYDMEFIVRAASKIEPAIRKILKDSGSELITQTNQEHCHVHIHTDNPLDIAEQSATLGKITGIIIRDMRAQYYSMADQESSNVKYKAVAFGKSPGFLAMFAMAGAQVAISTGMIIKKARILEEYNSDNTLMISSEKIELAFLNEPVLVVDEEARVLASLVSLYSPEKPTPEVVREAADYPRIASIIRKSDHFMISLSSSPGYEGDYRDCLFQAVLLLKPQIGEVLTLYYRAPTDRRKLEEILPGLKEEFPSLETIDLYFGGQEIPLVITIE